MLGQARGDSQRAPEPGYSSPALLKLVWPDLPMITWSWTAMPSFSAASTISRVISMSDLDGVVSPEGWLCTS